MADIEKLKDQIRTAFASVRYPGDKKLRGSDQTDEPFAVEHEFYGKSDWRVLSPEFIDRAPKGLGTALAWFSDAAFRFYLPAYLMADLDGKLERSEPRTYLTDHFERFAAFTREEAAAVAAFLEFKLAQLEMPYARQQRRRIENALINYWYGRADVKKTSHTFDV
jgi:uncharacterized protein DUF6714